jgi:hypothetical protein
MSGKNSSDEIKKLKNELEKLKKQKKLQKEKLEEFITQIRKLGHTINNNVFIITGYCDILISKPDNQEIMKKLKENIVTLAEHAGEISHLCRTQSADLEILDVNKAISDIIKNIDKNEINIEMTFFKDKLITFFTQDKFAATITELISSLKEQSKKEIKIKTGLVPFSKMNNEDKANKFVNISMENDTDKKITIHNLVEIYDTIKNNQGYIDIKHEASNSVIDIFLPYNEINPGK